MTMAEDVADAPTPRSDIPAAQQSPRSNSGLEELWQEVLGLAENTEDTEAQIHKALEKAKAWAEVLAAQA